MILFGTVELLVQNPSDRPVMGAQIHWLTEWSDWRFVKHWQRTLPPPDAITVRDSLEYAALAGKRWRLLREQKLTVSSWHDLRGHLMRDAAAEVGLALAITSSDGRGTAVPGVAFARRTWANNLILEFLASSPPAMSGLKGAGAALMHSLAAIGRWLTCGELWGECTAASRGFYAKLMQQSTIRRVVSITDRFQFTAAAPFLFQP